MEGLAGLGMALLAAIAGAVLVERLTRPGEGGERIGPLPLPELLVEGWLNIDGAAPPTRESLAGRHVVLYFWSTDCLPCLQTLPSLARFNERWQERGVEVVALASDPSSRVGAVEAAIRRVQGMDWPVAYGAGMVFNQLGVNATPTYLLFDKKGVGVWRGHSVQGLEDELSLRL
ncbi:TlpA disulfide reductase family protein [Botrimarina mediterranea]|uniref:TlpA disulfide reductase family protein n=1 Tax=Botrimarina mediterranea TaxID=2528022 RepID=UPI0011A1D341|nr:TlpA disulfide reductase family protein [Botrimarina mediterranea]